MKIQKIIFATVFICSYTGIDIIAQYKLPSGSTEKFDLSNHSGSLLSHFDFREHKLLLTPKLNIDVSLKIFESTEQITPNKSVFVSSYAKITKKARRRAISDLERQRQFVDAGNTVSRDHSVVNDSRAFESRHNENWNFIHVVPFMPLGFLDQINGAKYWAWK